MFFPEDEPEVKRSEPQKIVYVYENGMPQAKPHQFKISRRLNTFKQIVSKLSFPHLRLFNAEGAEYFEDDLGFVKNKAILYASNGENYDPAGCFGEYEIIDKLGEGGFGQVLLAKHRQTSDKVAIKIIRTDKVGSVSDIDNIFVQAQTLKALKHDNIVSIYNCLTLKDMRVAIIMEYLQGGELLELLKRDGPLEQEAAKSFIRQIAKAMHYCHMNGLIHRDLKLENMLLVNHEEKKIKIIDFGIAGVIKSLTWEDLDIGSLGYMSPECFNPSKDLKVDGRIDVWSTGIILYGMLFGELPFTGDKNSEVIQTIKAGKFHMPPKIAKKLSEHCLDILSKMLDTNHTTRLTMEEVLDHPWLSSNNLKTESAPKAPGKLSEVKEQENMKELKKETKTVVKAVEKLKRNKKNIH